MHQQLGSQAGDFFKDLGQLPILGKQGVDLDADTVGGRYSNRHGRCSFFADLQVVKRNLRPCSLFTPDSGHDPDEGPERLRVKATRRDYQKLLAWGQRLPDRTWAIEGAHGLGRHLAQFLVAAGENVVDVPAFLSARVRELSRGRGRKTDEIDALAAARAAQDAEHLHPVLVEDKSKVVSMLNERRANLTGQRTRTANQLHALLRDLVPGGHLGELTALTASRLLRTVRPDTPVVEQRKALAHDLLADIRRIDRQLGDIDNRLDIALLEHGTTLTEIGASEPYSRHESSPIPARSTGSAPKTITRATQE
ncbi:IS110 family transposase [Mycobacterium avium subsp. hominissuis]|nr:IS110 family transposase [Mycobacterium avium subsp. hominissuis]PBA16158.1 hypothetical protein CKJ69_10590 [Mycobacterium avium]MBZ4520486.1 IS110 family transposase [Mycobacterium avium subsp. hominissuis]MBZ4532300.1 IS110 family transposase [Mycobacterium avium subsp. hominissuis]MBZ4540674.1 IS110 family transposase [Mycobacterium avium subsp. hominissuis]